MTYKIEVIPSDLFNFPEKSPKYDLGSFVNYKGKIALITGIEFYPFNKSDWKYWIYLWKGKELKFSEETDLSLANDEQLDSLE